MEIEIKFAKNIRPSIANHVNNIILLGSIDSATGTRDVAFGSLSSVLSL